MALIFYFIARFIIDHYHELQFYEFQFNYFSLSIAVFLSLLGTFNYSFIWHYITLKNQCSISLKKDIVIWFLAEIGKFIPGKIFLLAGKIYYYNLAGKSKIKVVFCFYLEIICALIAGFLIFLFSLLFINIDFLNHYKGIVYFFLIVFSIAIHPKLIELILNFGLRSFRSATIIVDIRYIDILKITIFYVLNYILFGTGLYFLISSTYHISMTYIPFISGAFSLANANVIGILSLLAPSGIGVREGILILFLKTIVPNSIAGFAALLARIWATVPELVLILLAFIYLKITKLKFEKDT